TLDFRGNGGWTVSLGQLDNDLEFETDIGDLGLEHRCVLRGADLDKIAHAFDAGGKKACILAAVENPVARRCDDKLTLELHLAVQPRFLSRPSSAQRERAAFTSSGEGH